MTREERLAREAVIMAKNGLMNDLDVLRQTDKMVESFDPDEIAIAEARVLVSQAASKLIQLIQKRGW